MKNTIAIFSQVFVATTLMMLMGAALVLYWVIAGFGDALVAQRSAR